MPALGDPGRPRRRASQRTARSIRECYRPTYPANHWNGVMLPASQPVVRAVVPADAEPVAAIFAHYVLTSVATFEEVPPTAANWRRRLDDLAALKLPFLVAETGGVVCGYAYASPWRPKPAYRHTIEDTVYLSPGHTGRGIGSALLG